MFSLYIFYCHPIDPDNFSYIPHTHIFFSKWQPDPHESPSEMIFSYKAPTGTKIAANSSKPTSPSPSCKWHCWLLQSYVWQLAKEKKEPFMHNSQLWKDQCGWHGLCCSDSSSWLSLLTHCVFPAPHMGMEMGVRSVLKISTGSMQPLSFSAEFQWGHRNNHCLKIWPHVTIKVSKYTRVSFPKEATGIIQAIENYHIYRRTKSCLSMRQLRKRKSFLVCMWHTILFDTTLSLSSSSSASRNK